MRQSLENGQTDNQRADKKAYHRHSNSDIVNIGLHFILKNVRPYAAPCSEA